MVGECTGFPWSLPAAAGKAREEAMRIRPEQEPAFKEIDLASISPHPAILSLRCPCKGPQRVSLLFFPSALYCKVGEASPPRKAMPLGPYTPFPASPAASHEPRPTLLPPPSEAHSPFLLTPACRQGQFTIQSPPCREASRGQTSLVPTPPLHRQEPGSGGWTAEDQPPPHSSP